MPKRKIIASGTYVGDGKEEGPTIPMPKDAGAVIIREVNVPWRPGGAQGASRNVLSDGDRLLIAVHVVEKRLKGNQTYWNFHDVTLVTYGDEEWELYVRYRDEPYDSVLGWEWEQIDWYIPYGDLVRSLPKGE